MRLLPLIAVLGILMSGAFSSYGQGTPGMQYRSSFLDRMGSAALQRYVHKRFPEIKEQRTLNKSFWINNSSEGTAFILLHEFATGTGPVSRYFNECHPYTWKIKEGPGMAWVYDAYLKSNYRVDSLSGDTIYAEAKDIRYQFSPMIFDHGVKFFPSAIKEHVLTLRNENLAQFVLGSFNVSVTPIDSNYFSVHVWNTMSRKSLFAGIPQRVDRPKPLGNTYQHVLFTVTLEEMKRLRRNENEA